MAEIEKSHLTELAQAANENHRETEKWARVAVNHAMAAGDALLEAKALIEHGGWGAWLLENFEGSDRTARAYMRLANHREEVEAKRQASADLTIEGALEAIASPKPRREDPQEIMRRGVEKGAPDEEIAAFASVEVEAVRRFRAGDTADAAEPITQPTQDQADQAQRVAGMKHRTRAAEERHREEQRKRPNAMFLEADARLSKARRELKEALNTVREAEFDEEAVELLHRQGKAAGYMLFLVHLALSGQPGVDWDAELAGLEERLQYGEEGDE